MEVKTTRQPAGKGPAFKYKPRFGVVVICKDEADQQRKFARLKREGWKLKVVCV